MLFVVPWNRYISIKFLPWNEKIVLHRGWGPKGTLLVYFVHRQSSKLHEYVQTKQIKTVNGREIWRIGTSNLLCSFYQAYNNAEGKHLKNRKEVEERSTFS